MCGRGGIPGTVSLSLALPRFCPLPISVVNTRSWASLFFPGSPALFSQHVCCALDSSPSGLHSCSALTLSLLHLLVLSAPAFLNWAPEVHILNATQPARKRPS